ncbi:Miniconductance mechanosensitive channel MscM precursor [Tsuneonella dongtanensis]|uniref:Miniconductance mechanosensitive channel MscM n=1 Tax=Tsuneonella dongtanensis TaxID=692370 RepID=A0A1B2A997_9SPHN|nr:mechanosensitive ion channel domain-containing protein [Tsuneonella dongtanensis]ANY18726.1 Miniconductance mechanosensitive channel MscM precursor [Tsuneonella dongtanensis]
MFSDLDFSELDPSRYTIDWSALAHAAIYGLGAVLLAVVLHRTVFAIARRLAARTETEVDGMVVEQLRRPTRWAAIAIGLTLAAQGDAAIAAAWHSVARFVVPALVGWIAFTLVKAFAAALEYRAELSTDLAAARSRRTRVAILSRTATFAIVFVTVGLMLFQLPGVSEVGATLLASAGLAALAVGAAAQPALKSLIAGLQMAITEPLRLGDMVVIDGHTGRVEEIRMSFVVVRMWDERAAIVPTSRFLDNTFENWSRASEVLTGPVFLHLAPEAQVGPIRGEFERFVAEQPQWDRRTASALMTEARAGSIELRLAMSAATIAELFELRCAVREHMLDWLRREQPEALLHAAVAADGGAA